MTYEEALSTLRDFIGCLVPARASGKSILEYRRFEAFAKAIEALEKQMPKKPYWERGKAYCVCGIGLPPKSRLPLNHLNCCPECGQAIDWSDDE